MTHLMMREEAWEKKAGKKIRADHNHQMHAARTSAAEAILPDPTLENNAAHDSSAVFFKRLNGNNDSLIYRPFFVIVYSYTPSTHFEH